LGTDADFDGPDLGLGFGPGFFFGTDAAIFDRSGSTASPDSGRQESSESRRLRVALLR
jgi:hypothetical protein